MNKLRELWCCNRNVMLGAGAVLLGGLILFPSTLTALLPLLLLAACPLSCVLMAVLMGKGMQQSMKPSQEEQSRNQKPQEAAPRLVEPEHRS